MEFRQPFSAGVGYLWNHRGLFFFLSLFSFPSRGGRVKVDTLRKGNEWMVMEPFEMTAAGVRRELVNAWGRRALRQLSTEIGVVFDGPSATVRGSFADLLRLRERLMKEAPPRLDHARPPRRLADDDDERVYFCARCPFRARSIPQLTAHRRLHQLQRVLHRCPLCSFVSFNKSAFFLLFVTQR